MLTGSIQFINTTNNTKDNKINIGELCRGVTAVKDKIYIGGNNKVIILNTEGSFVREITTNGEHHHVHLILYHGMFHLVTTCVCRLLHLCIHDLVDPQPVFLLGVLICRIYI
jgi:hypothetical protein